MERRFVAHRQLHTVSLYVSYDFLGKQQSFPIQYAQTGSSDESGALRGARNKFLYKRIADNI
jgi:hypothetical protein